MNEYLQRKGFQQLYTQDYLEALIPTAVDPTGQIYQFLCNGIYRTIIELSDNLGEECIPILAKSEAPLLLDYATLKAFHNYIAMGDLILTPNGFGIVNTTNVAPASKERVTALKKEIYTQYSNAYDKIIKYLNNTTWQASPDGIRFNQNHFIKTATQARELGINNFYSDEWQTLPQTELIVFGKLVPLIGEELFRKTSQPSQNKGYPYQALYLYITQLIALEYTKQPTAFFLDTILSFVERHKRDFPEYLNSNAYLRNHQQRKENQKDEPTFYFGM